MPNLHLPNSGINRTATTACRVCEGPVRYYVINHATGKERRPPVTHGGECEQKYQINQATAKVERNDDKRKKSAAKEQQEQLRLEDKVLAVLPEIRKRLADELCRKQKQRDDDFVLGICNGK